ncbi:MAG: DUF1080 domain-containing protein [Acidobacteriota bacterium]
MRRRSLLAAVPLAGRLLPARQAPEEGFTSLFDGQTMRGWSVREGPESAFYASDGAIAIHQGANFPTWLRSDKQYENFDFRCEFFLQGWMDGGVYLHAPEHGRNAWTGFDIKLFHKQDARPLKESCGAIFPVVAPLKVNVRSRGEWNALRVLMDWPRLRVWMNEELVQDLDVEAAPELRHRLRRGYLGLESLSYPIRFRNPRIRELPSKEKWETLYEEPGDLEKWFVAEGKPKVEALGPVLRMDNLGHLATREQYRDFELHLYLRPSKWSNGGVLFRCDKEGPRRYEIQVHDVENAVYPTGSLYYFQRAIYPKIEPEQWFLMQLVVKERDCLVRINGENVMEHHELENLAPGHIMLQAHQMGRWTEYKHVRVKKL